MHCPLLIIPVLVLASYLPFASTQNRPPRITEPEIRQNKYVASRGNVTLNCNAEGTPVPRYKWYFNDHEVSTNNDITVNERTGVLFIKGFTFREVGHYQCYARNTVARGVSPVAVSVVITLAEAILGDWPPTSKEVVDATVGTYQELTCDNVPESIPKAQFSWFLVSAGDKKQVDKTERIYVDDKGSLHFVYVTREDRFPDRIYQCAIYNHIKSTIVLGSSKDLQISSALRPQTKPSVEFLTNPAVFVSSQTAELECVFSGSPIPKITWKRNNVVIRQNNKYEFAHESWNRKLLIKDLTEDDEGNYYCEGQNSVGRTEGVVFLKITSGPVWKSGLTYLTVPEGKDATFTCQAQSADNDLQPPVWFRNGVQFNIHSPPGGPGKLQFSDVGKVLTVINPEKSRDIACFQCNVSNSVSFEYDNACLNVIKPIIVTQQPDARQEIEHGEEVDLTVIGTTDPAFTLAHRWHFKDISYSTGAPPFVRYDEATKAASISTSGLNPEEYDSIAGTYVIELYNEFDSKKVPIRVVLKEKPLEPLPVVEGGFQWWWIIIVLLIIIAVVILIVCCCCRNKEKGAYRVYKTETKVTYLNPDQDIEDYKFKDIALIENDKDSNKKLLRLNSRDPDRDESET